MQNISYTKVFEEKVSQELNNMLLPYIDLISRDIHISCGGYPGPKHHMPQCCQAMYNMMRGDDMVLSAPPSRKGAYVTVRYFKRNHS